MPPSSPLPPLTVVGPLITLILKTSLPLLPFTVVGVVCVSVIVNVSLFVPRARVRLANAS